jgi:hypothetical protein
MRAFLLALIGVGATFAQTLPSIHVIEGAPGGNIGEAIAVLGDLDADGVPEIATVRRVTIFNPGPCPTCGFYQEAHGLRVFSGRTGALVFTHDDALANSFTSYFALADAGDLDGDGKSDVAWAMDTWVRVLSTQNGAVLRSWAFTAFAPGARDLGLADLADADGDGIRDLAVGEPRFNSAGDGRVIILSGATGLAIRTIPDPIPGGVDYFGKSIIAVGDLDGDALTDIVVGAPFQGLGGAIHAFSGGTGNLLWSLNANQLYDQLGVSLARAGDVDGNGSMDVIAGVPNALFASRALWVSGSTGGVLNAVYAGGPTTFGAAVGGGFDADGDGQPDVAIGDPFTTQSVAVLAFSGALLASHTAPFGGNFGAAVVVAPDLNGDGCAEIVTSNTSQVLPNGRLSVSALLGAQTYPGGTGPSLAWAPGAGTPSTGHVTIVGGTPFGPGLLGLSLLPQSPAGSPPVAIVLAPPHFLLQQPVSFGPGGQLAISLSLRQPSLAGVSVFLQAADLGSPGVATSNGLQLLFGL